MTIENKNMLLGDDPEEVRITKPIYVKLFVESVSKPVL